MMDILNQLGGLSGAGQNIGGRLGTSPQQTQAAMEAALPLLLGALTRNAAQPGGLDTLSRALDRHDGSALSAFGQGQMPDTSDGQKILGHVFGGQQTQAAQAVGRRAGIDPQLAMQLLTMLAPLVLGYLSRQRQGQAGGMGQGQMAPGPMGQGGGSDLGSILGGLLGGAGGGLGGLLGGLLNGGQQAPHQQAQQRMPDPYTQGGSVLGGGSVIPGYPSQAAPQQSRGGSGDLFGTLNRALDRDGDGGALDDLIGMFGGGRR